MSRRCYCLLLLQRARSARVEVIEEIKRDLVPWNIRIRADFAV